MSDVTLESCKIVLPSLRTKLISSAWSISSLFSLAICIIALVRNQHGEQSRRLSDLFRSLLKLSWSDAEWEANMTVFLILSGILLLLVNSIQMIVYITERNTTDLCTYLGFVYQLALDTIVVATVIIEAYLWISPQTEPGKYKLFALRFFVPLLLAYVPSYVPILRGCYGDSGAWCWISIRPAASNCHIVNGAFYQQMFIWYAKIGAVLVCGIIILIRRQYCCGTSRSNTKFTIMMWHYFISFGIANLSGLVNRIVTWSRGDPLIPLQIIQVIFFTLWPAITAFPILISRRMLEKLGWTMQR